MRLFLNASLAVSLFFMFYLMYWIGHSDGKQEQIIINLTDAYIEEGYKPHIATHMVRVELGIIPEDTLYTSIKED